MEKLSKTKHKKIQSSAKEKLDQKDKLDKEMEMRAKLE